MATNQRQLSEQLSLDTSFRNSEVRISLAEVIDEEPSSDETSRSRDVCSIIEGSEGLYADDEEERDIDLSSNVFEVESSGTGQVVNPSHFDNTSYDPVCDPGPVDFGYADREEVDDIMDARIEEEKEKER